MRDSELRAGGRSVRIKELLDRVLARPERDRAVLAERLLASLEAADPDDDVEAAWQREVQRRIAALDRGEVKTVPWEEIKAGMEKK